MINVKSLIVVLCLVGLCSCDSFQNEQSVPEELVGNWVWIGTYGGWGQNISADTAGYAMSLIVYDDNKAVWYKENGEAYNYKIETDINFEGRRRVSMYRSDETCKLNINIDELDRLNVFTTKCTDFPISYFKKSN